MTRVAPAMQATLLFCAWLAWSRFRVVIPTCDRSLPTLVACLEATLRRIGGVPSGERQREDRRPRARGRDPRVSPVHRRGGPALRVRAVRPGAHQVLDAGCESSGHRVHHGWESLAATVGRTAVDGTVTTTTDRITRGS